MSAPANRLAAGILPDSVIRTANAGASLLTVTLNEALTAEGVQGWLTDVTGLINTLESVFVDGQRAATVNVAFAPSFFMTAAGAPRFGLTQAQIPAELATPPSLPALSGIPAVPGDVLFYILSSSDAAVAAFQSGLSATHGDRKSVV